MPNKPCNKSSPKASNPDYICNPKTGRWIKATGSTAKKTGLSSKTPAASGSMSCQTNSDCETTFKCDRPGSTIFCSKHQGCACTQIPKTHVTRSSAPDYKYLLIDLDTENPDERKYIDQTIQQYATICKSVTSTPSLKRMTPFSSKLTQTTGTVSPLAFEPLRRLLPEHDTIYQETRRVLIVCVDKTDSVVGFLGGSVDALPILDKYGDTPRMDSYDRVKYINVYSQFGPQEDTEPDIPLSWVEILCVAPSGRGQNLPKQLITKFIEYCKSVTGEKELVLGVDVAGTVENGINLGLVRNYEKLEFKFDMDWNLSDVYTMFMGAQFGGQRK
jgi:GNAT superfamily N-acetyltransferase